MVVIGGGGGGLLLARYPCIAYGRPSGSYENPGPRAPTANRKQYRRYNYPICSPLPDLVLRRRRRRWFKLFFFFFITLKPRVE